MGSRVRNRNLSPNHSKNPPNPTKIYQSSSFYIPYMMSIKKNPNENRVTGTVPRAGGGAGWAARQAAPAHRLVFLRGFEPKTRVFTPKPQIRPFPTKIMFIQHSHTFNYIL